MIRHVATAWISRFAAAAILACVAYAVEPSTAQASCGDYVMVGGHGSHASDRDHTTMHDNASAAKNSATSSQPCKGAKCSRKSRPIAPSTPTVPPSPDQWGCLVAPASGPSLHMHRRTLDASIAQPEFLQAGIFRPPCA